jgi:cellulose synthase/poly-beta-1,6-N-acetylglucosamine synthase-like glycosyltransferase
MTLLVFLLVGTAALILIQVTVLLVEIALAVTLRRELPLPASARPGIVVVIPAHDEGMVIADTLRSIKRQIRSTDRLIVIADNCLDDTAAVAMAEGAKVLTRNDPVHRGKGYALDFAIRHIASDPPEVVLFVDADCGTDARSIDLLVGRCAQTQRPVQALYLMHAAADAGPLTRIAEFAWAVKNQVRPLGLHRLGLPCQLMGTGMAFPWACLMAVRLATGHIVEDVKLGIELARAGMPPLFCPQARVVSFFPQSEQGLRTQRTRWEHGHLGLALSEVPRMLVKALAMRNAGLMSMALDLSVPPLALLVLMATAVWLVSALFFCLTAHARGALIVSTAALLLLAVSVLLAWARYGRRVISLGTLALAGLYVVRKVPLYARFLISRQVEWVRSKRD